MKDGSSIQCGDREPSRKKNVIKLIIILAIILNTKVFEQHINVMNYCMYYCSIELFVLFKVTQTDCYVQIGLFFNSHLSQAMFSIRSVVR